MERSTLVGARFGEWEVLEEPDRQYKVLTVCKCGQRRRVYVYNLLDGGSRRCISCVRPKNPIDRLMRHVSIDSHTLCWNWTGAIKKRKTCCYGELGIRGKSVKAHRYAYELFRGPIPGGMNVCHHCDNAQCVNPGHLFLGSQQDNVADMMRKGRHRVSRGEECYQAKLTWDIVRAIRSEYKPRVRTRRALARKYHVSFRSVCKVVDGTTWKEPGREIGDLWGLAKWPGKKR